MHGDSDNSEPTLLTPLAMAFVSMLVVASTLAAKIVEIGPLAVPAGILCFPLTYIFGDVLVEVYGYARIRTVIWMGLACQVAMASFYFLSTLMPPAPFWEGDEAWAVFFSQSPRIVLGSLVGYTLGEFANAAVMSRMKVRMGGSHLWARTIGSTVIGQLLDTTAFSIIAFGGMYAHGDLFVLIMSGYSLKVAYEILVTPGTYACVAYLKRVEGIDKFDHDIDSYSPFGAK